MSSIAWLRSAALFLLALVVAVPVAAQEFGEVADEFRKSFEALRGYSWTSKSEYYLDSKLRSTEVFRVSLDGEGRITRELVSSEGKRTKQTDIAERALRNIRDMIDSYTRMNPENFRAAFADNPRFVDRGEGREPTRVTSHGVLSRGDRVEIWVDPVDYRLLKLEFEGPMAKEMVRLTAEFDRYEGGPTYVTRSRFYTTHKKKDVKIVTENSALEFTGR